MSGRSDSDDDILRPTDLKSAVAIKLAKAREEHASALRSMEDRVDLRLSGLDSRFGTMMPTLEKIQNELVKLPMLHEAALLSQRHVTEIALIRQSLERTEHAAVTLAQHALKLQQHDQSIAQHDHALPLLEGRMASLETKAQQAQGGLSVAKVFILALVTLTVSVVGAAIVANYVTPKAIPPNPPTYMQVPRDNHNPVTGGGTPTAR